MFDINYNCVCVIERERQEGVGSAAMFISHLLDAVGDVSALPLGPHLH